ncbi:hypothetical protein C2845_PM04G14810 [Panicum miliaceum]|uniref:Transcription repressor n=1 Tax=Panicum miliaceum TaxID=4540 RepID=A0A3L6QUY3_PANMI|nr:hypothetical protein C2845_PM04G14810 [Panicum miliaceum]
MEEEDAMAEESSTKQQAAACKKPVRLHRSFLRLSRALKKLHARRGHQAPSAGGSEPPPTPSFSAAASFLSGCMHHPRTHSFASARRHEHDDGRGDALAVNFRSLRIGSTTAAVVANDSASSSAQDHYSSDGSREREGVAPAPAAAAVASKAVVGGAGVAVVTFSAAPYEDFRRSMREMVDDAAGGAATPAVDWDFMEELLFCYLRLNDRAVHGDILRAFTDTVAALRRRRRRRAAAKSRRARRRDAGADSSGGGDVEAAAPS